MSKVLLQTARTKVFTSDSGLLPVRLLLDSGSQRSYLTSNLMQQLQLQPVRRKRLNLNTFGNEQFNRKECDMVQVRLLGSGDEVIVIEALSFSSICSPLPQTVVLHHYPDLQELDLADIKDVERL